MIWSLVACAPNPVQPVFEIPAPVYERDQRKLQRDLDAMPAAQDGGPSVVIIVLDTLRADRLAAYGGDPELMPNLNAWGEDARVYTEMRATSAWTLPTHASLFTGAWPATHGAHGAEQGKGLALDDALPTLAERMGEGGYRRIGVAANRSFLGDPWGLERGFESWLCDRLERTDGIPYVRADRVVALAETALQERPGKTLLFLNFMEAHTPWIPREGYVEQPDDLVFKLIPRGGAFAPNRKSQFAKRAREVMELERHATDQELAAWAEAYNSEVRFLDAQLGELFAVLEAQGHDENDYTIILADHGEFLGEHQLIEHSRALHDEVVHVPLLIRGPGFEPGLDDAPIQTADVPDVLLAALGMPLLTPEQRTVDLQVSELYWAREKVRGHPKQVERFDHITRAYELDDTKLLRREGQVGVEFDLAVDPSEDTPLEPSSGLGALGDAWLQGHPRHTGEDPGEMSAEQEQLLRELGYIE